MVNISQIEIKEIRGISHTTLNFNIIPNKPNLIVAPNGTGKSSIAAAFSSLKRNSITVDEDNLHNESSQSNPYISMIAGGTKLEANSTLNTISNDFSVFVINSQLYSKTTKMNRGRYTSATSKISVKPITLINRIPDKKLFNYTASEYRQEVGECRKLLINLKDHLKDPTIVGKISRKKDNFERLLGIRNERKIGSFLTYINQFRGTKEKLIRDITDFSILSTNDDFINIISLTEDILPEAQGDIVKYINALQLIRTYKKNKADFANIVKYYEYLNAEAYFNQLISSFDSTWKQISPKKKNNSLILELPAAHAISNGERDILCFIAKLFEARYKLVKEKCILIIDEIFDYLDDGNLIAAQYFINNFISEFRDKGDKIYPIILTHLDPFYFKTYRFNIKNIHYIDGGIQIANKFNINNLLKNRPAENGNIPKYFLHFHPDSVNEEEELRRYNLDSSLYEASQFRTVAMGELNRYKNGQSYDIAFVCCGLRITVEEKIYYQLAPEFQEEFLNTHTTVSKLNLAKEKGITIPEPYYLLSIIYNEGLHLDSQCKKLIPVGLKLGHKVIKKMICDLIS